MKKIIRIIKLLLLTGVIVLCSTNKVQFESRVNNNNIKNKIDLSTMALKISEFDYDALYSAIDTYTGDLTGYVYNCPACSGRLACLSNYDLSNGTTTFKDEDYGDLNIVASSANLSCGSVIRFNSERISDEPIYAIVLDRGVRGNAIDFLSPDYNYATTKVGRSSITYDVVRNGW